MRKIIVMLAVVLANFVVEAQVKTPQSSPLAKIDQVVGLTNVQIEYSRPSANLIAPIHHWVETAWRRQWQ